MAYPGVEMQLAWRHTALYRELARPGENFMFEIVQVWMGSSMCCFLCKRVFKEGDEYVVHQIPIPFRFGKERKKAGANTHIGLKKHVRCE